MTLKINYLSALLDRMGPMRIDASWRQIQQSHTDKLVVPLYEQDNLIINYERDEKTSAVLLKSEQAEYALSIANEVVLLGVLEDKPVYAVDLTTQEAEVLQTFTAIGDFINLRKVGPQIDQEEASLLAYARGVLYWHHTHQYCGVCGSKTESREAGHMRMCLAKACGNKMYPKLEPAVIMLIEHLPKNGEPLCLLARHPRLPDNMYSTLAGFVEIGESIEQAVYRETLEEVNISVKNIRYQASQPWPFPASLMLGFFAESPITDIKVNQDELCDAHWFSLQEITALLGGQNTDIRLAREDSIAHYLIASWAKSARKFR